MRWGLFITGVVAELKGCRFSAFWCALTLYFSCVLVLVQGEINAKPPELYCEKKWGEWTWKGMQFHRYHLRAEHFPANKKYCLVVESFDGTQTETFSYVSNKKGHLILVRPDEDDKDEIYAVCPVKRGERLTFWMRSQEDAYFTQIVPFPLAMRSKKGARLHLELQGEKGEKFLFLVEELESYEEIELFLSIQGEQVLIKTNEVSESGDLSTMINCPTDLHGGEAQLILKRKKEEIVFPFQWGALALKLVGACCFEIK